MIPARVSIRAAARRNSVHASRLHTASSSSSTAPTRPSGSCFSVASTSQTAFRIQTRPLSTTVARGKEKRWENHAQQGVKAAKEGQAEDESELDKSPEEEPQRSGERSKQESTSRQASSPQASASTSASAPASTSSTAASTSSPSEPPSQAPARPAVPDTFPEVLILPVTRKPLFPDHYKSVNITNPAVIKAVEELKKRGQNYVGVFMLKDSDSDTDIITSADQVHPVGVFAEITSTHDVLPTQRGGQPVPAEERKPDKSVVLWPHRRIRLDRLLQPKSTSEGESVPVARVVEEVQKEQSGDEAEVASFEKDVPSVDAIKQDLGSRDSAQSSAVAYLRSEVPEVSIATISDFRTEPYKPDSQLVRALLTEIQNLMREIAMSNPLFRDQLNNMSTATTNVWEDADRLADVAAAASSAPADLLQEILATATIEEKLQKSLQLMKQELISAREIGEVLRRVDSKQQERVRHALLMERMKLLRRELGMDGDSKDKLVDQLRQKAAKLAMPEGVRKVFDEEINKLQTSESAGGADYNVTRNYLDWLVSVPWGVHSVENFNIPHASSVLNEDHYGLEDIKDRILEFLAVGKLRGTVEGKIICLVGPPGVGKTSIGKSIARALGRQFYRFSVGGLANSSEIKGHRRTYVGAMPGKAIQALKRVGTENPLILVDEVDKLGHGGFNGDPGAALLEMLDPEQNSSFLDHYLDVPVDLSRVLFVCTANNLSSISAPLLDRMEVLEVSGYVSNEKTNIAEKYLAPQAKEANGLQDVDITIDQPALESLIRYYCRESGVRNLKKHIDKIYRKAAFKIVHDLGEEVLPEPEEQNKAAATEQTVDTQQPDVKPANEHLPGDESPKPGDEGSETPVTTKPRKPLKVPPGMVVRITKDNLHEYVGPAIYRKDRLYTSPPPPGVSSGLGYLGNGSGSVMPIEVTSMPGKGGLQLTGKLGEVIRESAQIAMSWVKSNAYLLGATKSEAEVIMNDRDLHIHMPEGAIGKEGPSAGTAILSALVSLFTKTKVDPDVAMTGEISLLGQVLPVGGLKEKILAAQRAGITKLVVPSGCKPDIDENVPASVKEGIEFVYVDDVLQVLHEVFKGTEAEQRWQETLPVETQPERVTYA